MWIEGCSSTSQSQVPAAQQLVSTAPPAERPREAWVTRSVLDLKPRMLSVALHKKLWVAYNTQTGALYKAWLGKINFDGPVFTAAHGPQPTTVGPAYLQEGDENPWRIISNGTEQSPKVTYRGHRFQDNQVVLRYELEHNGKTIRVEEKPEFFELEGDRAGFERVFTTSGVPNGVQVALKMNLASLASESDYKTDGKFELSEKQEPGKNALLSLPGTLLLNSNGRTNLSLNLTPQPVVAEKAEEKVSAEEAAFALMAKSDCNTCHNRDLKTVGPAYMAIAERYDNDNSNKAALIAKVIKGGAGNWGQIPMTPHPNLSKEDAAVMVSYILSLDAQQEAAEAANKLMPKPAYPIVVKPLRPGAVAAKTEKPGMAYNVYQFSQGFKNFPEINEEMRPVVSGTVNALHFNNNDFGGLKNNFVVHATGFINIQKTTNVVFRLVADDGARLLIDNQLVVENGGQHPLEARDGEIILKAGKHPFKVEYYQHGAGKGLSLQWRPYGANEFVVVPPSVFTFKGADIKKTQEGAAVSTAAEIPGDGAPLTGVHPSFTLSQARPDSFKPVVGGIDFLADGRMVVSTWDSLGAIYLVDGRKASRPEDITVKRIAFGLAEPLGVKVVDNNIYVMQKQELTRLVDTNKDDVIDEYQTVCNGWQVSANFHEFAFGLVYQDGYFYGTLATAINPGGASTKPQIPDRGKIVKIAKKDGSFSLVSKGLRTPNGVGFGVDQQMFIADNQGDWLPASKIVHLQDDVFYGSRSVDFEGTANLKETLPVVWLPQDDIGNSPSQPAPLNVGPYQNQMIHGDVTHGGIKRVFAEKVNGAYQGVVFRFTQGLEAGVNRLAWGPDGALYVGGVGSTGNWGHTGKLSYGLQKLIFNNNSTFEMLAVRAKPNGVEIEFTEPLQEGLGLKASDYQIRQWYFKPTADYGGPKIDDKPLAVKRVTFSDNRRKVLLELPGMKAGHVVYIRLNKKTMRSDSGKNLWTTEAWYTMNSIPAE